MFEKDQLTRVGVSTPRSLDNNSLGLVLASIISNLLGKGFQSLGILFLLIGRRVKICHPSPYLVKVVTIVLVNLPPCRSLLVVRASPLHLFRGRG